MNGRRWIINWKNILYFPYWRFRATKHARTDGSSRLGFFIYGLPRSDLISCDVASWVGVHVRVKLRGRHLHTTCVTLKIFIFFNCCSAANELLAIIAPIDSSQNDQSRRSRRHCFARLSPNVNSDGLNTKRLLVESLKIYRLMHLQI